MERTLYNINASNGTVSFSVWENVCMIQNAKHDESRAFYAGYCNETSVCLTVKQIKTQPASRRVKNAVANDTCAETAVA